MTISLKMVSLTALLGVLMIAGECWGGVPNPNPESMTPVAPADCITAGSRTPDASSCCPGLARIFVAYYDPAKSCEELSQDSVRDGTLYYICSAVGNGNCESWENRCNSPRDCIYP